MTLDEKGSRAHGVGFAETPGNAAGFEKVWLAPGEAREVAADDLAFYHPADGRTVESGRFEVSVGRSSRDPRLDGSFEHVD